jgi:YD repeat-containing protein
VDSIAGTITRAYDGLNQLTSEATPQGTVGYTYDNGGRRQTMTVPGQITINYTWDNANRLTGITQGSQNVGLNFDNANRRTCLTLPNGVIASYGYDNDSRVTSITYGSGGSCSSPPSNLGNLTYTYDANGHRTAVGGTLAAVNRPANLAGGTSCGSSKLGPLEQTPRVARTGLRRLTTGRLRFALSSLQANIFSEKSHPNWRDLHGMKF